MPPTPQAQPASQALVPAPMPAELVQLQQFKQLGHWLQLAELDDGSPASRGAGAALRFALASQLGVNPTAALTELSFIHGRLNLSAQLVRALASQAGYRVVQLELDDDHCLAAILDKTTGQEIGRTGYTMADAKRQGLIRQGGSWVTNPQRMLWARASKRVVDDFAPEVSLGITTPEDEAEISGYGLEGELVPDEPDEGELVGEVIEDPPAAPADTDAGEVLEPSPPADEPAGAGVLPEPAPAELEPDPGSGYGDEGLI